MRRRLAWFLALSVTVNCVLLVAYMVDEGHEDEDLARAVAVAAAPRTAAKLGETERAECAACETDLQECKNAGFVAVADAMERRASEMFGDGEDDGGQADAPDDEPPTLRPRAVDTSLQQDALCQIAREHLRRHWEASEEDVLAVVQRDLTDPSKQRDDLERDMGQLTGVLGLADERVGEFGDEYAPLRAARIETARAAIAKDPPDWNGVLKAAQGLFSDEDKLAQKFGGKGGRDLVRLSQLEKRTALLGIVATYADQPWGDEIAW